MLGQSSLSQAVQVCTGMECLALLIRSPCTADLSAENFRLKLGATAVL